MTRTARTRISRVKMKDGGADLHILRLEPAGNTVVMHAREWLTAIGGAAQPPDAYAAVAIWFDPECPGNPGYSVGYSTVSDAMPISVVTRIAANYLVHDCAAESGKHRALDAMGCARVPWKPDDAT
jgi:hypothetical protein